MTELTATQQRIMLDNLAADLKEQIYEVGSYMNEQGRDPNKLTAKDVHTDEDYGDYLYLTYQRKLALYLLDHEHIFSTQEELEAFVETALYNDNDFQAHIQTLQQKG